MIDYSDYYMNTIIVFIIQFINQLNIKYINYWQLIIERNLKRSERPLVILFVVKKLDYIVFLKMSLYCIEI